MNATRIEQYRRKRMKPIVVYYSEYLNISAVRNHILSQLDPLHNDNTNHFRWPQFHRMPLPKVKAKLAFDLACEADDQKLFTLQNPRRGTPAPVNTLLPAAASSLAGPANTAPSDVPGTALLLAAGTASSSLADPATAAPSDVPGTALLLAAGIAPPSTASSPPSSACPAIAPPFMAGTSYVITAYKESEMVFCV
ncbi:hypothetical protein E8E13_006830 [Curvularia kusanoi]|uniref:Uncharacterized protein n=1 Tax=Curvularia kusanoi TaxID=90978 RepID=A0A9P4TIJ1_CURKU|nr:hypothetical protein E8E13_006830 [Curvularia kusanoi]